MSKNYQCNVFKKVFFPNTGFVYLYILNVGGDCSYLKNNHQSARIMGDFFSAGFLFMIKWLR